MNIATVGIEVGIVQKARQLSTLQFRLACRVESAQEARPQFHTDPHTSAITSETFRGASTKSSSSLTPKTSRRSEETAADTFLVWLKMVMWSRQSLQNNN